MLPASPRCCCSSSRSQTSGVVPKWDQVHWRIVLAPCRNGNLQPLFSVCPLQDANVQVHSNTATGGKVRSSLFRACTGKCRSCWAQCAPERGDSSSVAFFEASKPYLSLCTSRSLMLCWAGKGRSTSKQDTSASSTSLFLRARYGGRAAPLRKSCSPQPKHSPCVLGTCTPRFVLRERAWAQVLLERGTAGPGAAPGAEGAAAGRAALQC